MEVLSQQANGLNGHRTGDVASRLQMQDALHSAAESMETSHDTMLRLYNNHLEVAAVRVGCDLNLFKILSASDKSLSLATLAEKTGAEPLLLGRILRYLASTRIIKETGTDEFAANNSTTALADDQIHDSMYYIFDVGGPAYQALPGFLREEGYKTSAGKFAFQKGVNTDLEFFPWIKQHPEKIWAFQRLMSVPREGDWLDAIDFQAATASLEPTRPVFIDVGGNLGHQSQRLVARYPHLKGRVIVQDLQESVNNAPTIDGVEFRVHNFFTPEPIKGARFYYMRTVLHDWSDEDCAKILRNIAEAMDDDSEIVIDDMVLPDRGVHWWSAALDLHMYTMLGALERTESQWKAVMELAGLELKDIRVYMPVMRHGLVIAGKKKQ